jgi:short-subunit dehydrogenase
MMEAAEVAKAGYRGLMKGKRVVIPGKIDSLNIFLTRFFPPRFLTGIAGRMMRNQ